MIQAMFLEEPPQTDEVRAAYDEDREDSGYVWNTTRLWSWKPGTWQAFFALQKQILDGTGLTDLDRAVMVPAAASTLGDSYCSFAWGKRLAKLSDPDTAAGVLRGVDVPGGLSERERALADWARAVARDPNATTPAQVERLRAAGLGDREIFEATAFVALRIALSTINDALGASPDLQLADSAPAPVREAVTYGRPVAIEPSPA